jgi:hypothetical protein
MLFPEGPRFCPSLNSTKRAYFETSYVTLLITVIETSGGSLALLFGFSRSTHLQQSEGRLL